MNISQLRTVRIAATAVAVVCAAPATAQTVDTTEWICEFCPFEDGYRADYEFGATSVSDESAYFGNARGLGDDGVHADINGDGSYTTENQRIRWQAEDLGLDARSLAIEGGRQGQYDYRLAFRQLPRLESITTQTV